MSEHLFLKIPLKDCLCTFYKLIFRLMSYTDETLFLWFSVPQAFIRNTIFGNNMLFLQLELHSSSPSDTLKRPNFNSRKLSNNNSAKFSLFYDMCSVLPCPYSVIFFVLSFSSYLLVSSYLYSVKLSLSFENPRKGSVKELV